METILQLWSLDIPKVSFPLRKMLLSLRRVRLRGESPGRGIAGGGVEHNEPVVDLTSLIFLRSSGAVSP